MTDVHKDDAQLVGPSLETPWDELRKQRVQRDVVDELRARWVAAPTTRRRRAWAWAGAGSAAAAAATLLFIYGPPQASPTPPAASTVATAPSATPDDPSQMKLADGSTLKLASGASVDVDRDDPSHVRVEQRTGTVRYDVIPNPERAFVVAAAHVQVTVLGTAFDVEMADDAVDVLVHRGRVRVDAPNRSFELTAGEHMRVQAPAPEPALAPEDPVREGGEAPTEAKPATRSPNKRSSLRDVLNAADEARARGDLTEARGLLEKGLRIHGRKRSSATAHFTFARVLRAQGDLASAAEAFERCAAVHPKGPLAADALAQASDAWTRAGRVTQGARVAREYLKRHPEGTHARRLQARAR